MFGLFRRAALAACVLSFIGVQAARGEDAPASTLKIELEKTTVPEGGTLVGKLVGTWSDGKIGEEKLVLRLAWIDGAGRVVNHVEIRREKHASADEPIPFALAAEGGMGRSHRLVALVAPRAKKKNEDPQDWRVAAEAAFKIDRAAEKWDGYQVLAPGSVEPEHWKRLVALGVRGLAPLDPANGQNAERLAKMDLPFLADGLIPPQWHAFEAAQPEAWKAQAAKFAATRDPQAFGACRLFDENELSKAKAAAEAKLAAHAWLSPLGYALGDAPALNCGGYPADAAADALTLDVFRAWLKDRYGSLEKLNRHWGTTFPRWEEVRAPTTDEAKADADPHYAKLYEALRAGDKANLLPRREGAPYFAFKLSELAPPGGEDYAAWCDWRAFQDFAFARMLGEYRSWVRAADAGARVGLTGTQGPSAWSGYDWSRLASVLDWCAPEGPDAVLQRALYKSFNPAGRTLALLEAGPELRRGLWDGWLQGDRGALLEKTEKLFAGPASELTEEARALEEDLRALAVGLAEQRARMREQRDGVAIYYSPRSLALHWMLDSRLDGSDWVRRGGAQAADRDTGLLALRAWHALLMDLGYTPKFVEPRQLLAGKLDAKVLVLPKVLSLSDEEAAAIKEFARLGGVVIADSQCGVFDGAGKRRESPHCDDGAGATAGILDEAFGIRRTDFWAHEFNGAFHGDGEAARVILEAPDATGTFGPVSSELRVNEPGLRATGAWRYGRTLEGIARRINLSKEDGTAALLIRPGGLGRFVYLNLAMQDYPRLREQAAADFALTGMTRAGYERLFGVPTGGEALRVLTGDMLFEALGEPALVVRAPDGTPLRGVARLLWTDGGAELIALLPPAHEPRIISKGYGFPHAEANDKPGDGGFEYIRGLEAKPTKATDGRVAIASKLHWYDARSGGYLGLGNECRAKLDPDRATLLAALPYKVAGLHTKVRRTNPQGVFKVWAELETDRAGADGDGKVLGHILRLEIYDPQGRHLPHYDANLYAEHGRWEGTIALGLNEPAGNYRALFRDALTGAGEEAHLLKEGELYGRMFPPSLAEQRWTAEPSGQAGKLMLDGDGAVVYRRRVRMTATGQGLTAPPQFDVRAPKPWSFESFAFPAGRFKADDPTPEPYEVDLVLKMRGRELRPETATDGELVVKTPSGEEHRALPFRVALVPQEEKGGIEIDGKLGDRGWGRAPQVAGFALKQDGKEDASAAAPTEATVVYLRRNETHLLIGVQCNDREFEAARNLKLRAEDRDDEALASGDWFEAAVAVEGGKAEPVRVRIDPRGRIFDARGKDVGWNLSAEARCAAEMQKKGWSAELAIPWKDLGLESAPDEGRGLRLGFERRRVTGEHAAEQSVWRGDASRPASDADALGVAMTVGK
ncbi:MAG: beta-galactosidase [Planctomycetes bacterium]|nr:beta-galactosidase [Planctomycetota bacterium]